MSVSIVVPCRNEAANILPLVGGIVLACAGLAEFEIVVVDDGSVDGTADLLRGALLSQPALRVLRHDRPGGQSAAVHSGVLAARFPLICTLDGDGQNPPEEIPRLLGLLAPDVGLVAGQRVGRRDGVSRRLASRFANGLRSRLLGDGTRDSGCGLKAFRREAFLALPYFDHMHRYLPALFQNAGWQVAHLDVSHRPRLAGRSHYSNLQRGLVGLVDLIGVSWLIRRRKKVKPVEVLGSSASAPGLT